MARITKTLISLVKDEAKKLKENATKEELGRLSFLNLFPDKVQKCIYGQMTGRCYSERANELIILCAEKVYVPKTKEQGNYIQNVKLNGKPIKPSINSDRYKMYHSPIEIFILRASEYQKQSLINYLRNETLTLDL